MGIGWNEVQIRVRPETCILFALAFFVIPWQWMFAWTIATAFHELSHYMMIRICRHRVWSIDIGIHGTIMNTEKMSPFKEGVCAIAGPVGSVLLTFTSAVMPRLAICGLFHFLYNILPVYPLDGGRVVKSLLSSILPEAKTETCLKAIGYSAVLSLLLLGIYGYIHLSLGPIPLFAAWILLLKIKIPCKQRRLRVQ